MGNGKVRGLDIDVRGAVSDVVRDLIIKRKSYDDGEKIAESIYGVTLIGKLFRDEVLEAIKGEKKLDYRYSEGVGECVFVRFSGGDRGYEINLDELFKRFN